MERFMVSSFIRMMRCMPVSHASMYGKVKLMNSLLLCTTHLRRWSLSRVKTDWFPCSSGE